MRSHQKDSQPSLVDECPTPDELALCIENASVECSPSKTESLSQHIEICQSCQATLAWIAGSDDWWNDARRCLTSTQYEDFQHMATTKIVESVCALNMDSTNAEADPLCEHETEQLKALLDPPSHPELLGRIGRYELEQLVGRGGMGLVFRGYDTELHRIVAVKTLAIHLVPVRSARERFIREGRACASLVHPHIVPVHDVIPEGPVPALVMQYVAGPTLEQWTSENGPMPLEKAFPLMLQLAEALVLAHEKGFVHRDIKPGNVLLEVDASRALLTDFGLVRALDDATLTHSGMLAGTPDFMSPEQARGATVGFASDLFSLGSLFYTMLSGSTPFEATEPMAVMNRICHEPHRSLLGVGAPIPKPIADVVDRLLEKDPSSRLGDARDLLQELQEIVFEWSQDGETSASGKRSLSADQEELAGSSWNALSRNQGSRFVRRAFYCLMAVGLLASLIWALPKAFEPKMQTLVSDVEMTIDQSTRVVSEHVANSRDVDQAIIDLDAEVESLMSAEIDQPEQGIPEATAQQSASRYSMARKTIDEQLRSINTDVQVLESEFASQ